MREFFSVFPVTTTLLPSLIFDPPQESRRFLYCSAPTSGHLIIRNQIHFTSLNFSHMKNLQTYTTILLLLMAGLFSNNLTAQCMSSDPSSPVGIVPTQEDFPGGNPQCGSSGGYRINSPEDGVTEINLDGIGAADITINITDGPCGEVMTWTAASYIVIDEIVCKGGPGGQNVYNYTGTSPRPSSDGNLHCPLANPNAYADFSHIDFCFHYRLSVSKDAETTYTRTWNWEIDKTVTPDEWAFFSGDDGTSKYTVSVDKVDYTDSDWAVSGTITITNNTPFSATITSITDEMTGDIVADVECGGDYTLAPGESLECTYSSDLPDGTDRVNTVTVETDGSNNVDGNSATADVKFGDPTTVVNDEISVEDSYEGPLGTTDDDASWMYERTFDCDDEGTNPNTATIVETEQEASADVEITCYDLTVTKTVETTFDRNWEWTIEKTGDQTELTLSPGQSFLVNYSVTVDAAYTDDNFAVSGTITINNPHPSRDASLTTVADIISPNIAATVNCPSLTVPAGESVNCTYSASLPDNSQRLNTATASLQNYSFDEMGGSTPSGTTDFSGSANVTFSSTPTNEYDECVDVTDDLYDQLGTVCAKNAPKTFEYSMYVGPYEEPDGCGEQTVKNTASFETNDNGNTGSDSWTVNVNVACEGGCTHTIGYWKTHSKYGPAPYDATWALVGEDSPFFLSGKTWYQAAWTAPAGNAYYILAHQYIAAHLNFLDGASVPAAVQTAFNSATTLFNTYTPAQIAALKGSSSLRKQFINLAGILDNYNNGITGPGHCDEENGEGGKSAGSRTAATTLSGDFSVYPNPTSDAVQIDLSNFMEQSVELVMYNQLGAVVLDRHIANVDASIFTLRFDKGLPSGIYNLTLVTATQKLNKSLVVNK